MPPRMAAWQAWRPAPRLHDTLWAWSENDEQYSDVKERLGVRLSSFHEAVVQNELGLGRGLNGNFRRLGSVLRNEARLA